MSEEREESLVSENSGANQASEALEEAHKKASENWDLFLRARAEGENIRRRSQIDLENAHKYGLERFAKELLTVLDSLDRGLEAVSKAEPSIREGYELTHKMFLNVLDKFGVQALNPVGEPFDPLKHEALTTQMDGQVEPNTVLTVFQKGFTLHDRLLRPARVVVSRRENHGSET